MADLEKVLNAEVKEVKGKLVVSSRVVAEQLSKEHKNVLKDINNILKDGSDFSSPKDYFIKSEYVNKQNKKQPEYLLTKKGFILLVMNYQGYNQFSRFEL